ncbi:hypothetical protein VTN77DRAFT_4956 [Rasamsonia byssochlamydoides]|uniref:uncharacterized protein n=1 Tax=Rasamsonia byssochlamydoides TaxID=89139 RepID=UPI0037420B0F
MLFQSHILISFLLGSLVTTTTGVTLRQFTGPSCTGNSRQCSNIDQDTCCQSQNSFFSAALCPGCVSMDVQVTWVMNGSAYCGKAVDGANGNECITVSTNLTGHSWSGPEDSPGHHNERRRCTKTVEPDLLQIGSKWFRLDETVSGHEKAHIWRLWSGEALEDQVPGWFLPYEVDPPEDMEA